MLFVILWLAATAAWVAAIVDAARRPKDQWLAVGRPRDLWILLVVLTGWFGALYYFAYLRRQFDQHATTA